MTTFLIIFLKKFEYNGIEIFNDHNLSDMKIENTNQQQSIPYGNTQ